MPYAETKKLTPTQTRRIKGSVPKRLSKNFPAIRARITGTTIQVETLLMSLTPSFHHGPPILLFWFSATKTKPFKL